MIVSSALTANQEVNMVFHVLNLKHMTYLFQGHIILKNLQIESH